MNIYKYLIGIFALAIMVFFFIPRDPYEGGQEELKSALLLDQFKMALFEFKKDCGRFPSREEGLKVLISQSDICPGKEMHWPYYPRVPVDGWRKPLKYLNDGKKIRVEASGSQKNGDPIYFECQANGDECIEGILPPGGSLFFQGAKLLIAVRK